MWRVVVAEGRCSPRVAKLLEREGLTVECCPLEVDLVLATARLFEPDLVVLETTTLGSRVSSLCNKLQAAHGVLVAVAVEQSNERSILDAYDAGARLVIPEPIGEHELVARIRALLRRAPARAAASSERIVVGPIVLDRARRILTVDNAPVSMPRKEFDIAELLMCSAGTVITRTQMMRELWGTNRDSKTLDVQVGRLRARLQAAEGRRRIVTVRGVGYRFMTEEDPDLSMFVSSTAVPEPC